MLPRLWGEHSEEESGRFSDIDETTFEYLKNLGINAIWYTGIIRHSQDKPFVKGRAGSPYAIYDYFDVNPYLADEPSKRMEEFENLVRRTHEAGLKVIIDFVPNHVGRDNVNFGRDDDKSVHWKPENDFFYYPGEAFRLPCGDWDEMPARASGNAFTPTPGENDWYETVKLNYCDFHTQTWDKMLDILKFWSGKGVDGFRCDMVELVPWQFFRWAIAQLKEAYPHLLFIAEVYRKESYHKYIYEVGFELLYDNSGMYDTLRSIVQHGADAREISACWQNTGGMQAYMLNFLENHDEQRLASDFFAGDAGRGFAPLCVSALLNEASFMLYFGEEVGERGMDSEGFSGLDGRTTIFDWYSPKGIKAIWREIHGIEGLSTQQESVLERYREILRLAANEKVFSNGKMYDLCYCNTDSYGVNPKRCFMFLRSLEGKTYLVVANFSEHSLEMKLKIPAEAGEYFGLELPQETGLIRVRAHDGEILPL